MAKKETKVEETTVVDEPVVNTPTPEEPVVVDETTDAEVEELSAETVIEPETTEVEVEVEVEAAEPAVEPAVEQTTEEEEKTEQEEDAEVEAEVAEAADDSEYPKQHMLTRPVTIYRAPDGAFAGKSFGGMVIITGPDQNGFTPVKLNRGTVGLQVGYVKTSDLV